MILKTEVCYVFENDEKQTILGESVFPPSNSATNDNLFGSDCFNNNFLIAAIACL